MKQLNLFILISLFMVICACGEDEDLMPKNEILPLSTTNDSLFFRSEADAVFTAINALSEIYPNDKRVSHSKKSLKVKNVTRIKSNNSTSSNKPGFYIINFEDGGFAMIPNDTRATEVYAYSDKGSLQLGVNDNVDYYFSLANDYLNNEIENSDRIIPNIPITPIPDPNDPRNYALVYHGGHYCHKVPTSETTIGSFEYLLSSKWHQEEPYYNKCLNSLGEPVLAGCVTIALGQIMAYHQKPASHNGHTYLWDLITQRPNLIRWDSGAQSVSELIHDIGVAAGINYWDNTSFATLDEACNALNSFGYNNLNSNYSFPTIVNNIDLNRPCFVCGYGNNSIGHVWVIDGYKSTSKTYKYYMQSTLEYCSTETKNTSYVHCNWGWAGEFNGFFLSNVFNNNNTDCIYDELPNIDTTFNYSNNLKIIYDIYQ